LEIGSKSLGRKRNEPEGGTAMEKKSREDSFLLHGKLISGEVDRKKD